MTIKDLLWNKQVKYTLIGICTTVGVLIGSKILYDYTIYSNLKYVKKQLGKINIEEL